MGRASFCHQLIAGFFNDMHITWYLTLIHQTMPFQDWCTTKSTLINKNITTFDHIPNFSNHWDQISASKQPLTASIRGHKARKCSDQKVDRTGPPPLLLEKGVQYWPNISLFLPEFESHKSPGGSRRLAYTGGSLQQPRRLLWGWQNLVECVLNSFTLSFCVSLEFRVVVVGAATAKILAGEDGSVRLVSAFAVLAFCTGLEPVRQTFPAG